MEQPWYETVVEDVSGEEILSSAAEQTQIGITQAANPGIFITAIGGGSLHRDGRDRLLKSYFKTKSAKQAQG